VAWNANGVPIVQIFQMDKSYGADGLAVRNDVKGFADLKGKTVGVDAPGTAPYFGLAWMLSKNGMSLKDVKVTTLAPQAAARPLWRAERCGHDLRALSVHRARQPRPARSGHHARLPDGDGHRGLRPWLKANPKAAQALTDSYFAALEMIKNDPAKSNEIMGAAVKQTASSSPSRRPTCAGRTRRPTRSSLPASCQLHEGRHHHPAGGRHHPQGPREPGRHLRRQLHQVSQEPFASHAFRPGQPVARRPAGAAPGRARTRQRARWLLGLGFFVCVRAGLGRLHAGRLGLAHLLASPVTMAQEAWLLFTEYGFHKDIGMTVWRVLGGFVLAASCRRAAGHCHGRLQAGRGLLRALRLVLPLPAGLGLHPAADPVGRHRRAQKLLVIFIGSFFQIVLMVAVTWAAPQDLVEAAYTLGATTAASCAAC
jgi:hypothetical protein